MFLRQNNTSDSSLGLSTKDSSGRKVCRASRWVLTLAPLSLLILLVVVMALFAFDIHVRIWTANTGDEMASRLAADAGLGRAVAEMNGKIKSGGVVGGPLPHATNELLAYCGARYSYSVSDDPNGGYTVNSVGQAGLFTKHINASLQLRSIFDYAIYARTKILLDNNVTVNAADGAIGVDPNGQGAIVGANSSVEGDTRLDSWDLMTPAIPAGERFDASKGALTSTTTLGPDDSGRYDFVYLTGGKRLRITGCSSSRPRVVLYIPGDVVIQQAGAIEIAPQSALVLYVKGSIIIQNGSSVNNITKDAGRCLIVGLGTGNDVWLGGDVRFYGVVYAPQRMICLSNGVEVDGAIVGDYVTMLNRSSLKYDSAIRSGDFSNLGLKYVVAQWSQGSDW